MVTNDHSSCELGRHIADFHPVVAHCCRERASLTQRPKALLHSSTTLRKKAIGNVIDLESIATDTAAKIQANSMAKEKRRNRTGKMISSISTNFRVSKKPNFVWLINGFGVSTTTGDILGIY